VKELRQAVSLLAVGVGEGFEHPGERFDAASTAFLEDSNAFGSGFEADAALVVGGFAFHEAGALEAGDDAAHRGWLDLFGFRQLAEGTRAPKNQDRERRKLGRADSADGIASADAAEQMDRRGMEFVGDLDGVGGRRYFVLAFGNRI
jgi:hypothetical protein